MILVDSSIWDAAKRRRDKGHEPARKVLERIAGGAYGKPIVTDYIVDEVLTWLKTHVDPGVAAETATFFFMSDQVEVVKVDWAILREALEIFMKHDFLSFTDSTTVAVAKARGVKNIATLDEDFSKLGFNVIEE
ncbi:MAG: PIN domain-containing protein [Candidatus Hadarchaeales archaeon]